MEAPADPLAVVPDLIAAAAGEDHVLHERDGRWSLGVGAAAEIVADPAGVRLHRDGRVVDLGPSREPLAQVEDLLSRLDGPWSAFGWVSSDLAAPAMLQRGAHRQLHLVVPRTQVTVAGAQATLSCADPALGRRLVEALGNRHRRTPDARPVPVDTAVGADEYRDAVARALDAIAVGRVHKVVLSRRVPITSPVDLPATFVAGRRANSPARSLLLSLRGVELAGFCPETVVSVDAHGAFTSEPLAGTRACPADPVERARLEDELRWDPKEVFEHTVSVRAMLEAFVEVSEPGTAIVDDLLSVRRRGSVQHLATRLRGRLGSGRSPWDAFAAAFPTVTGTGIPRRAARDLAAELEPCPRGLYAGAAVRVDHDGAFDSALILRSVHQAGARTWLQAGGGIVAGSDPDREVVETHEKLASIAENLVAYPGTSRATA